VQNSMIDHMHNISEDLTAKLLHLETQYQCLETQNHQLETQNRQLADENRWLKEQFLLAQHRQFGTSSERTLLNPDQCGLLFNEAEAVLDSSPQDASDEKTITYTRGRKSVGHRQEMLSDLPVEEREYRLPEDEQVCSCCGGPMHEMSTQTRDELTVIPAQWKVIRHIRYIYSCRYCERNEINVPIVTAPAPAPLIPKSLASPSALAYIMGMKFVEGMPLYRLEKHFERLGVMGLSRALLSNWMIKGGERLEVICDRLKESLLLQPILHADETTLQVLREDGRRAQSNSYMWLYRSGRDRPPIVLYEYQPTRAGEHPRRLLSGFTGYLHVDGYAGYNGLPGITLVGCWAHARRHFTDALKVLPKSQRNDPNHLTNIGLAYINRLFQIERALDDLSPEERKSARIEQSKPVVDEFKEWLSTQAVRVLPKCPLGQAITYCQGQWSKLIVFLTDGRLELDNNRSERSIKPFVIGRKNWLFANTPRGARTSAIIYSIVETAKENGLNPSSYLQYVFERLPETDLTDKNAVDALLPWSEIVHSALNPTS
jgi:transposase